MNINSLKCLSLLISAIFMLTSFAVTAKNAQGPGGQLEIFSVYIIEGDPDKLIIHGQKFDFGSGDLSVELARQELVVTSATDSEITAELPSNPEFGTGDYLLSVYRQGGTSQGDDFNLTIAAKPSGAESPCFDNINRFVDCNNGTVTDTLTGLIWLKDANCEELAGLFPDTSLGFYAAANQAAASLSNGTCGLQDNSAAGDWRLPTKEEWSALVSRALALGCNTPALTDRSGTACYATDPMFVDVQPFQHWTSTSYEPNPSQAWNMSLGIGSIGFISKSNNLFVWPVRKR